MSSLTSLVVASGSTTTSPLFFGVFAAVLAVAFLALRVVANRRNRERADHVLGSVGKQLVPGGELITFTVAPARPFPEGVAAVRTLLDDPRPEVRITRYSRPVVVVDRHVMTLSDADAGPFLVIPAATVTAIAAARVRLRPRGSFPITRPALTVHIRRDGVEEELVLAPITGLYDGLPLEQVRELAISMGRRLGFDRR